MEASVTQRLMTLMLGLYISAMNRRGQFMEAWQQRSRRVAKRVGETGGFFSENFLYLAVFSIPVAFLFFLLARKYIVPYAQQNIFPCFDGSGGGCFNGTGGDGSTFDTGGG
jgi:hypothetical protein